MAKKTADQVSLKRPSWAVNHPATSGYTKQAAANTKVANLAKTVAALRNQSQGNNGGGNGSGGGGGGGGVAAPVSTLASLPQTPELAALMQSGLIREGMSPEQALSIMATNKLSSQVPIDIAALKAMIAGDYASSTQGVTGPATEWMQQLYGANAPDPNDPNAALYMQDPIFGQFAGGLQQMQQTANTNEATDLAWFDKQQQAMTDYYSGLMATLGTAAPVGSGGSGGGGGGRGRGGGGGGGGGGGDNGSPFSEPDTKVVTKNAAGVDMDQKLVEWFPGFYQAALDQFPDNAFITAAVREHSKPDAFTGYLSGEATRILADLDAADQTDLENQQWTDKSPEQFQVDLTRYLNERGMLPGDDPSTPETEFQYEADPGGGNPVLSDDAALDRDTFDPLYQQFLSGQSLGLNPGNQDEALQYASDYLTKLLDPNRVDPFAAKLASARLAGKGTPAPTGNEDTEQGPSSTTTGTAPIPTTGSWGAASIFPDLWKRALGNNMPADQTIGGLPTTVGVNPQTGGPMVEGAAVVDPAATGTAPRIPFDESHASAGNQDWLNSLGGGTTMPTGGTKLQNMQPHPGQYRYADSPAWQELIAQSQQGGNSMEAAIAQLPPEVRQAAAEHAGGPPGITDINWALMQAGERPLNSQGQTSSAGQPASGPQGFRSQLMPDSLINGLAGAPAGFKQAPMGDPVVPAPTKSAGITLPEAAPSSWRKTLAPADQREAYRQLMLANAPLTSGMGAWNLLNNSGSIQQAVAGGAHPEPFTPTDIVNMYQGNIWTTDATGRQVLKPEVIAAYQNYSGKMGQFWQRGYNDTTGPNPTTPGQFYDKVNIMPATERATNEGLMKAIQDAIALSDKYNPQLSMQPVSNTMDISSSQGTTATSTVAAKDDPAVALEYTGMKTPPLTPDQSYQMDDNSADPQSTLLDPRLSLGFRSPSSLNTDPYTINKISAPQPLAPVSPGMDDYIRQAAQNMTRKKVANALPVKTGTPVVTKAPVKTYQAMGSKVAPKYLKKSNIKKF